MKEIDYKIQRGVLVGAFLLAGLANVAQVLAYYCGKRPIGSVPFVQQRFSVLIASCFVVSLSVDGFGSHTRVAVSVSVAFFNLAMFFKMCGCSFMSYHTIRNAYLALYLHSKTLPLFPFRLALFLGSLCLLTSTLLQLLTNQLAFSSLTYFSFSLFLLTKNLLGLYYTHQLVVAASTTTADSLTLYYRVKQLLTPLFLSLAGVCMWFGVQCAQSNGLVFDENIQQVFDVEYPAILFVLVLWAVTWWAWRPLRAGAGNDQGEKSEVLSRSSTTTTLRGSKSSLSPVKKPAAEAAV